VTRGINVQRGGVVINTTLKAAAKRLCRESTWRSRRGRLGFLDNSHPLSQPLGEHILLKNAWPLT